ncbi:MAG: hypothetical protein IJE44_03155 [Clostridia bacterium]|nr:hypothetical protein [Clostridia bacterium]
MKKSKTLGIVISALIIVLISVIVFAVDNQLFRDLFGKNKAVFYGQKLSATINGKEVILDGEVMDINDCIYIPSDKILSSLGYTLGWDDETKSTVVSKRWGNSYIKVNSPILMKGNEKYSSLCPTLIYKDILYIPVDMFTYLTDCEYTIEGELTKSRYHYRDTLKDTTIGNDFRLNGNTSRFGQVYITNNFAMERVEVSSDSAFYYASIVNMLAESLPDTVNVYNILVPTASEIYGTESVYTDQLSAIKHAYSSLSQRVIPINAVRPLYEHAGEDIYFRTDHHWTQRGAYYVYKELMAIKDQEVPPLSSYEVRTGKYTGSFANFAKGTRGESLIRSFPDTMERFMIPQFVSGASYNDMYLKSYNRSVQAVYGGTNAYVAFLGGDNPITVLKGSVGNGKKLVILKESYGNAFAPWALNNYSEVYIVDIRKFNSAGARFKLREFYDFIKFDDLVMLNYPVSVASSGIRTHLLDFVK